MSQETFEEVQAYVDELRCVNAILAPSAGRCDERQTQFNVLRDRFKRQEAPRVPALCQGDGKFSARLVRGGR